MLPPEGRIDFAETRERERGTGKDTEEVNANFTKVFPKPTPDRVLSLCFLYLLLTTIDSRREEG